MAADIRTGGHDRPRVKEKRIIRVGESGVSERMQPLADEATIELYINGRYVAGLVCTMENIKELLVGFLFSEGIITALGELKHLDSPDGLRYAATVEKAEGARPKIEKSILAPGCGHTIVLDGELPVEICHKEIDHDRTYTKEEITAAGRILVRSGEIHKLTRGTHGAAVLDGSSLITSAEDISRHNAVDKVIGYCRMNRIPLRDKLLTTTGRISSEIVRKMVRNRMGIIVSRTVPTAAAVELADHFLITTVGTLAAGSFSIYSQPFRIEV